MYGTQPGVGQAEPAEQAGEREILAHPGVGHPFVRGSAQRSRRPADPVPGQGIAERVGPLGEQRLDQLGEGVHPAGRDHRLRQVDEEVGIDHGHLRQQQRTAQAGFHAIAGQHGVAGHLRPRTCGGRHGDARQSWLLDRPAGADDLEMIHRIAAAGRQHSGRLGDIQRAAAAEPEHRITAGVASAVRTSRSRSTDGSVATPKTSLEMPASVQRGPHRSARAVVRPVTTRTRRAFSAENTCGTSPTRPAPNRTSAGTARSKRVTAYWPAATTRNRRETS